MDGACYKPVGAGPNYELAAGPKLSEERLSTLFLASTPFGNGQK
jgi:hypothetical protein